MLLPGRVADDAQEPIVEARSTLNLDTEHWIRNTGMHNFWPEMPPFLLGRRWAARLRLAGVKSLLQWWGDRLPLYCVERAILHLWGCSHRFIDMKMPSNYSCAFTIV
jgi:hypothetical protein